MQIVITPMCSNFDRQSYAKKVIKGKGNDVINQRNDRRQRLIQKFKSLRIQAVDSLRNLKENEFTYELLCELKKQILSTLDQRSLVQEDEIDDLLEDLNEELKVLECEQYEQTVAEEVDSLANNLLNKCDICDKLIMNDVILCEVCIQRNFSSQF